MDIYSEKEKRAFSKCLNSLKDAADHAEQAWFAGRDPLVKTVLDSLKALRDRACDLHDEMSGV